jgi:neurotransmitter:Na+ symporter, NSS family
LHALKEGAGSYFSQKPWLVHYFRVCIKYTAPILIILVFLHAVTQG